VGGQDDGLKLIAYSTKVCNHFTQLASSVHSLRTIITTADQASFNEAVRCLMVVTW